MKGKVKIDWRTHLYEFSHGKAPKGYGTWAFDVDGEITWVPQTNFSEAKRIIVRKVREKYGNVEGYVVVPVKVLP